MSRKYLRISFILPSRNIRLVTQSLKEQEENLEERRGYLASVLLDLFPLLLCLRFAGGRHNYSNF
jgi:hypothetical protein